MKELILRIQESGIDLQSLLITGGAMLVGFLLLGLLSRALFGNGASLSCSISSVIAVFFLYAICILLYVFESPIQRYLAPLPLVHLAPGTITFFSFKGASFGAICTQLVNTVLLAFLVNLITQLIPKGKNLFVWFLLRILTVFLAGVLHLVVAGLISHFVPQGIAQYSAIILLALLVLMLVTGSMRLLVGAALTAVNPIIAALYTFFFASVVGKQVTRAVCTTILLSAIILILRYFDITALSILASGLIAYLPLVIGMTIVWYLIGKLL